ncbi:MAG: macrolide ABC transporter ATP-binding protein [Candidatus Lloydbacteria bacterium RIFCSPHIGHO2_02_FULL_54_17]|uniref:Macrolide ABC transporter ATP-binding protein n=1 Tax=Candidatus Lloydbacteria bacterium RIFCSPHIGHO2_02_FULL_54_17 TaxID=1798664 RepID=A0A1G2DAP0_9BACT|nr:MAG: macrolide ABC transporter ATP-binding protein [Candidatus Lloydbacteria bacterium RIFCSPHIGHO2_01_FULL_54_11]OGZ10699.1 MAG: macrolide ABC transporter ATP-binding protein [Candidatus Lloydbacteria bacterium RIFCSPHIGHO2_02_FULL_54_17]OGZ12902.1 MAG: macrolide ABC transporter ATP-binding protein [Candidatus Lloydbacteria bacterium RIFCSPLOWO2_01_FULL_54_18]OGZ15334.1 MAG: macrolide ABC transporter ATP-binding protein [Candidatus Lloydbacteria bacterium RIFCSPLOWO2_02_FULL_54_12]
MPLIEAKQLKMIYASEGAPTVALGGVDCTIEKGEFVAVMGPSGSGKSTLLQILGLLDRPTEGEYHFDGKSVAKYSDDEQAELRNRSIGFVFQQFNLLARTSVLENVKLPLAYSSVPQKEWDSRAKKLIEAVGLSHRMYHEPSQLSGGEKQRVAIARALVTNPEIIFADEPTGNLDSASGAKVIEILRKLHNEDGHTVVLITHDEAVAREAKRVIALKDGMIVSDTVTVHASKR